ncbi:AraC family transcriptional regulator [Desulfohalovibrio reitneri]|uniref:AraC family transcriptional regulator n=1 Tax=Desulfohalovibrio reitneri TaxID=1307759 RepID=UPI0005569257|nr:AraC family transcriptional regulator [Desulfohalovibrio reitneri]
MTRDRALFWRPPQLPESDLLAADFYRHRFAPHIHREYAIGVCLRGAERFRLGAREFVLPPGRVCAVNPGEVHTGEAADGQGWSYRMFYPSPGLLAAALGLPPDAEPPRFPRPVLDDPECAALLLRAHVALQQGLPGGRDLAVLALGSLARNHALPASAVIHRPPDSRAADRARRILEDDPARHLPLDQLARRVDRSPEHLVRSFKQRYGLPPHAWQIQRRVALAADLLRQGTPPAQAAHEAGFTDQSHLGRHFKRVYGVPPARFAKGVKIVQDFPAHPA